MKISAVSGEDGYALYASAVGKLDIIILLNGRPVGHVIAADDQAGQVRVMKMNAAGKPEFDIIKPTEPWEETVVRPKEVVLTGTVQIIITTS